MLMMRTERGIRAPRPARLATIHPFPEEGHAVTAHHPSDTPVTYKTLDDFPGYRFGSDGSIWSRMKSGPRKGFYATWHMLKTSIPKGDRRPFVMLRGPDGKPHRKTVNGLICRAFHGERPEGRECCHDPDPDPANNAADNLRWDTREANRADSFRHGTMVCGEAHPWSKLSDEQIAEMRALHAAGMSQRKIADRFGVRQPHVSRVVNGVRRGRTMGGVSS